MQDLDPPVQAGDTIIVGVPLKMKVVKVTNSGRAVLAEPIDRLRPEYAFIWEKNKVMPKMYVLYREGGKDGLSRWRSHKGTSSVVGG
jgi:hypothetical protein